MSSETTTLENSCRIWIMAAISLEIVIMTVARILAAVGRMARAQWIIPQAIMVEAIPIYLWWKILSAVQINPRSFPRAISKEVLSNVSKTLSIKARTTNSPAWWVKNAGLWRKLAISSQYIFHITYSRSSNTSRKVTEMPRTFVSTAKESIIFTEPKLKVWWGAIPIRKFWWLRKKHMLQGSFANCWWRPILRIKGRKCCTRAFRSRIAGLYRW